MSQDVPDESAQALPGDESVLPPTPPLTPGDEDKLEESSRQEPPPDILTPPVTPEEAPVRKSPPRTIGPMPNLNKIVAESLEVIAGVSTQLNRQKHFLASSAYLVYILQKTIEAYEGHICRMNRFLMTSHRLQERWYCNYSRILPTYGDYDLVLKDSPEKISVEGLPIPIAEEQVKLFVQDVIYNLYAGGQQVKIQRVMNSKINEKMDKRREISGENFFHYDKWMMLLTSEVEREDKILSNCFEMSSHIEFLTLDLKEDTI